MPVSKASRVSVPPRVLFRDLGGEAVLLELESGQYFGLDAVGTRMFALLADHGWLPPVLETLRIEYEVTPEQLESDLVEFIDRLAAQRLLRVDEE